MSFWRKINIKRGKRKRGKCDRKRRANKRKIFIFQGEGGKNKVFGPIYVELWCNLRIYSGANCTTLLIFCTVIPSKPVF
jgi:hypothetical protein